MTTCGWCKFDLPPISPWDEHVKKCRATKGKYGATLFTAAIKEQVGEWVRVIELKKGEPVDTQIAMVVTTKPYADMFDLFVQVSEALDAHGITVRFICEDTKEDVELWWEPHTTMMGRRR